MASSIITQKKEKLTLCANVRSFLALFQNVPFFPPTNFLSLQFHNFLCKNKTYGISHLVYHTFSNKCCVQFVKFRNWLTHLSEKQFCLIEVLRYSSLLRTNSAKCRNERFENEMNGCTLPSEKPICCPK